MIASLPPVTLIVMLGEVGPSLPEQMLGSVREAIALDTVEKGLAHPRIGRVVVSTNRGAFVRRLAGLPVQIVLDPTDAPFHFGRQLRATARAAGATQALYIGGGAAPLLSFDELGQLAEALAESPARLVTNNLYSSDMVGFNVALLDRIELPNKDNDLAWRLAQLGGQDVRQPPRAAGVSFDIDTVTDILILSLCRGLGRHTAAAVGALNLDTARLDAAARRLRQPAATLLLAGRASASAWQTLEQRAACGVRVIAEERGMRASGRLARGEARSLLGYAIEHYGFEEFFGRLGQIASAALIDSRVLFAHWGPWPAETDRCYSDLGRPALIEDERTRRLTEAALNAPIPVVLGGHSLLSGGIYALLETMGL
jgi:hypothetical protein